MRYLVLAFILSLYAQSSIANSPWDPRTPGGSNEEQPIDPVEQLESES